MKSSNLDPGLLKSNPLWPHLAQRAVFLYIPAISFDQNLAQRAPLTMSSEATLDFGAEQGRFLQSDGTGSGHLFDQPFELGTGHDFTFFMVYRFDVLASDIILFATQGDPTNRGISFEQSRVAANGGSFAWIKNGVVAIATGLPLIWRGMWNAIAITYRDDTGKWVAVHRSLGADPNDFDTSHETAVATGTDTDAFTLNDSGTWRLGAQRDGGRDLAGGIAFAFFGLRAVPEALLRAWVEDWRAPFRPVLAVYRVPVAVGGANPKGPLGMPLVGPFGGPIG